MRKRLMLMISAAFLAPSVGSASEFRSHVLYDQSGTDNPVPIVSQNFEPPFSIYDANGADDFPSLGDAKVTEVIANGFYNDGSGPADSFDVIFYKKITVGEKAVARVQATCLQQSYTDLDGGFGYPDIKLHGCTGKRTFPNGGWVAIIANMSFARGKWGWHANNVQNGSPSVYRTPNDPTRCPTYVYTQTCVQDGEGPDLSFALLGR